VSPALRCSAARMGCGMVVCALLVSLLVIMGIAFFGKENPYRRNVRAFLTDVKLEKSDKMS
jgi:hypothetical protein